MRDELEILQEILLRVKGIEMTIQDIQGYNKEPIHQTLTRIYHEGIDEGKKQALEAMKNTVHSHQPQENIYAKRKAFDKIAYFVEETPSVCGNCIHWEHDEFSDEGRCNVVDEPRMSSVLCNVTRD